MPLSQAEAFLDHLTSCSPCYQDFLRLQADGRRRRVRMIFAVAASVLIVVGLATWAMLRHNNEQIAAVIDLRDRSMARGIEPPPTEPPLEIPRDASHLEIFLPLGSNDGPYDLRVTTVRGELLFSGAGEAKLEKGVTTLRVDLRMSLARPGNYLLQIHRHTSEWVSFPLQIR